jgi:hypothetical protein
MIYVVFLCVAQIAHPDVGGCEPMSLAYQTPEDCKARIEELRTNSTIEGEYFNGPIAWRKFLVCKEHQTWPDV